MTTSRPRKPWRVVLTGPQGQVGETSHTSEAKTFEHVRTALRDPGTGADMAKVMQWSDGRWWHFETVTAADLPAV
jgi:hypothetical protein